MTRLLQLLLVLEDTTTTGSGEENSSTEKLTEALRNIVKSPAFYAVIGGLVLLIIVVYLLRRIIKPRSGEVKVIIRGGKIYKLIDENSNKYFMVPFKDGLSAIISLNEREFDSNKLFINNGPDALYKINYTLKYKVNDVVKYYPYRENFQNVIVNQINDELRQYADNGHVLDIIKDYRDHSQDLVALLNKLTNNYGVEIIEFKINYIEPLGKK